MAEFKPFTVEQVNHENEDSMPFFYMNPETEGKVKWACGYDKNGRITSVFQAYMGDVANEKERNIAYLSNVEEAKKYRDELIASGWIKDTPPRLTTKDPKTGQDRNLNRKEKRYMAKIITKEQKNNPLLPDKQ